MNTIPIDMLTPHPRNSEFFDDITGEKWDEFLESIRALGVIEPILITQGRVIVSGHQRVRACKELGIEEIPFVVKEYGPDPDEVLLDLIETNIRQRGDIGGSAQKIGRRIQELERIYGVRQGSAKRVKVPSKTEADIADEMGISEKALENYKKLADMIPELSEAVDAGTVTQGAALAMMKQLSEDEQLELLAQLDATRKYTQRETQSYIEEINSLKSRPPAVRVIEKAPDDYNEVKAQLSRANQTINGMKSDYRQVRSDLDKRTAERDELRDEVNTLKKAGVSEQKKKHQIDTGMMFTARVNKFIEDVAGYIWLTDEINELPELDRKQFARSVQKVKEWAETMQNNIERRMNNERKQYERTADSEHCSCLPGTCGINDEGNPE